MLAVGYKGMTNCEILIINSPLFRESQSGNCEDALPPLGLGYIATHLQRKGYDLELIDAISNNISVKDLVKTAEAIKPKFIAINIFSTNCQIVKEIVVSIKIQVHFIIGGIAARALYEQVHAWDTDNHIDVVFGDGELITEAIITDNLSQSPSVAVDNRRYFVVDNASPYFIKDISELPLNRTLFKSEPLLNHHGHHEVSIITSRGCIYDCAFCSAARSLNRTSIVRERGKESIKNELHQISKQYNNVASIRILDDLFLKSKKSIIDAADIFSEFHFSWRSMAHIKTFRNIDKNLLVELKESGCTELFIGIESGSNRILKMINKDRSSVDTKAIFRNIFMSGISVKGYFILGFPSETENDFIATFELAKFLKKMAVDYDSIFRVSVFQFRPYHGTKIYDDLASCKVAQSSNIVENSHLTSLIGRSNFNFSSGIYSATNEKQLYKYIECILNLNQELQA